VNQVFSLSTPKETMLALEKLAKEGIQRINESNDNNDNEEAEEEEEEDSSSLKQWSEFTLNQMTKMNSNTLEVSFFSSFCICFLSLYHCHLFLLYQNH
jgi:hypothetical protein